MAFDFPADCDTAAKRTEYCYRAQELLRLLHNIVGKWYREGSLPQEEYDSLPGSIKAKYHGSLTKEDWDDFVLNYFEPKSSSITEKLLENRELLKKSTQWQISIEDI